MKRLIFLLILTVFLFLANNQALAIDCTTERCATCDLCGYCQLSPTPGSWESCRNCLYPSLIGIPASENQTLKIDETENNAPTPVPGSWYTMIGCIRTNIAGGFSGQGAAGGVVQTLLNTLFSIAGGVAFLYILYGSFIILTSQADAERLNYGKRVVYGAIIGAIFSISAVFLVNLIGGKILNIPGFGGD